MSNRADSLSGYRAKRDPERTPEPFGGGSAPRELAQRTGATRFVIQLHRARRLHYDFRIEAAGVLKSWAVPKGFPTGRGERRLAVEVEDHPIEYGTFEGIIPAGSYGAGAVVAWDRGVLRPAGDIVAALERGTLEFDLEGYKLRSRYILVRPRPSDRNWLLIGKRDAPASALSADAWTRSIFSGRTVEEIAEGRSQLDGVANELRDRGVPERAIPPNERRPMLASTTPHAFDAVGWIFEVKYDGVRVIVERFAESIRLLTRTGRDVAAAFPEVLPALRSLAVEPYIIDGELIGADAAGRLSLAGLQHRLAVTSPREAARYGAMSPAEIVAFDCPALGGFDCRVLPLLERKALLRRLVPTVGPVSYCDHIEERGVAMYEAAARRGLEGIIAKRASNLYVPGRSKDWLKLKCERCDDFVIGGYTAARGGRRDVGALLLGQYANAGLSYAGRVGSGFSDEMRARLTDTLTTLTIPESPFTDGPAGKDLHYVRPELVCEVRFSERTAQGQLRHPRFLALRSDKTPRQCKRTSPEAASASVPAQHPPRRHARAGAGPSRGAPSAAWVQHAATRRQPTVAFTNLDKVFWPDDGYTKGDLIAYYRRVGPLLLPYLRDRPLVLTRYPDGIAGQHFYQQDAPEWVPDWVHRVRLYSKEGGHEIDYFVCNDLATLLYIANLGCIPLHVWASRTQHPDRPDWMVLDLDPGDAPFSTVVAVARGLHTLLRGAGLRTFVKTSGSAGLHLLVPLGARYRHVEVKQFAELVARVGADTMSDIATVERRPARRRGRVYIDYVQNGHGKTIVAPYAVRALPGATVSAPLRWRQVGPRLTIAAWTIRTLPARIRTGRDDPLRPVLRGGCDLEAALRRLERRLS